MVGALRWPTRPWMPTDAALGEGPRRIVVKRRRTLPTPTTVVCYAPLRPRSGRSCATWVKANRPIAEGTITLTTALVCEFGLSMHVESRKGDETRNVLIDFGFTSDALNNNLELLRAEPATLDALVLSH